MFAALTGKSGPGATDEITAVVAQYAADTRAEKLDLGIGIYRDAQAQEQLMQSVDTAAQRVIMRHAPKGYLGINGEQKFLDHFKALICGPERANLAAIQTVGGTGAVRLGYELGRQASPAIKIHVGLPSWSNHVGIAQAMQLPVVKHRYYDLANRELDYAAITAAAQETQPGDIFVLHGTCHNPTGVDLTLSQRLELLARITAQGALPLFDLAYYGLGAGLDEDLEQLRTQLDCCPHALIAASCSKAFGLYQDRVGALFVQTDSATETEVVQRAVANSARTLTSSSPAHGALLVAEVLSDDALRQSWRHELGGMRQRVLHARELLSSCAVRVPSISAKVGQETGLFTLLDVSPEVVATLVTEHAIYLPASGRINVSGLTENGVERLAHALSVASG